MSVTPGLIDEYLCDRAKLDGSADGYLQTFLECPIKGEGESARTNFGLLIWKLFSGVTLLTLLNPNLDSLNDDRSSLLLDNTASLTCGSGLIWGAM